MPAMSKCPSYLNPDCPVMAERDRLAALAEAALWLREVETTISWMCGRRLFTLRGRVEAMNIEVRANKDFLAVLAGLSTHAPTE